MNMAEPSASHVEAQNEEDQPLTPSAGPSRKARRPRKLDQQLDVGRRFDLMAGAYERLQEYDFQSDTGISNFLYEVVKVIGKAVAEGRLQSDEDRTEELLLTLAVLNTQINKGYFPRVK